MTELLLDFTPDDAPPAPEPFNDELWLLDCEVCAAMLDEMIFRSEFAELFKGVRL